MKSSSSSSSEKCIKRGILPPFFSYFLLLTTIFIILILYSPNPLKTTLKRGLDQNVVPIKPSKGNESSMEEEKSCNWFQGHWIPDTEGPQYTNSSCRTLPKWMNCFLNGRQDTDFINWRWKPDKCDLPRFDPKKFLEFVRGKKLAFVGDSLARNHMESFLCLLSTVESLVDQSRGTDDSDNRKWYFPNHDFTITFLRTNFLVFGEERVVNGSSSNIFDLHLDKLDESWIRDAPSADYIVISSGHWFFRPSFLHKRGKVIGCVYCNEQNVTNYDHAGALRLALRAALGHISNCNECGHLKVTLVMTFSPTHFEHGAWNEGGKCNRTSPRSADEVGLLGGSEMEMRKAQMDEIEKAKKGGTKMKFGIVDVTKAMLMRPDGHPGEYSENRRYSSHNDCLHWCLPGPIDVWSDFLNVVLREEVALE